MSFTLRGSSSLTGRSSKSRISCFEKSRSEYGLMVKLSVRRRVEVVLKFYIAGSSKVIGWSAVSDLHLGLVR